MKIGIISDTHNHLQLTQMMLEYLLSQNISYLIHAGDAGEKVFQLLLNLPIPTIAVYGNNDRYFPHRSKNLILETEPYYFKIKDTSFKLMHHPFYLSSDSDVIIYGHLHRFECQKNRSLFLNPGEVCAREKPRSEGAILELDSLSVTYCYFDLNTAEMVSKKVC